MTYEIRREQNKKFKCPRCGGRTVKAGHFPDGDKKRKCFNCKYEYKSEETTKCAYKNCPEKVIGEQTDQDANNNYVTIKVCHKHAWPALKNANPGESDYGINVGWKRYEN